MSKRQLLVDWSKVENASHVRKKLKLEGGTEGTFTCPVSTCLHFPFKSKRGCRKHVDTKHGWYYHFDCAPVLTANEKEEAAIGCSKKAYTRGQPSYSVSAGAGKDLVEWLGTPCGGSKKEGDARQSASRALKYLMFCSGNNTEEVLTHTFIDCCVGSTTLLNLFLKEIQTEWRLRSSGSYNYLRSIADLMDFRKAHGVNDNVLRSFAVTEVYLRRGLKSLSRKKQAEWSSNLQLEKLIAENSWATITEMEEVLPYHAKRFAEVVQKCRAPSPAVVGVQDLVFTTRFITTLLFIKVKSTRPMTYQYLTVDMIEVAKGNGGFVDQTQFKTNATYTFDTIIIDNDVMQLIDVYISVCRPKLFPKCDYLLVNTNGNMCQNLCTAMSLLVHAAIGKFINPTRYRQIVETESCERLCAEERETISQDQKHSSAVAKVFYQKKLSREVAQKGKECMQKLIATPGKSAKESLTKILTDIHAVNERCDLTPFPAEVRSWPGGNAMDDTDRATLSKVATILSGEPIRALPADTTDGEILIAGEVPGTCISQEVKEEELDATKGGRAYVPFTKKEDEQLRNGIEKYGRGNWAKIINDSTLQFHSSRSRNTIRIRADAAGFKAQQTS